MNASWSGRPESIATARRIAARAALIEVRLATAAARAALTALREQRRAKPSPVSQRRNPN